MKEGVSVDVARTSAERELGTDGHRAGWKQKETHLYTTEETLLAYPFPSH